MQTDKSIKSASLAERGDRATVRTDTEKLKSEEKSFLKRSTRTHPQLFALRFEELAERPGG